MALTSIIPGEEYYRVAIGAGMYTAELPSNIPDGFSAMAYNMVATGDSLENRTGIRRSSVSWAVREYATGNLASPNQERYYTIFPLFSNYNDATKPAFAWAAGGYDFSTEANLNPTINFVRCMGTGSGDGFLSKVLPAVCFGICQYRDTVYFSMLNQGVNKISTFDWVADNITYANVASSSTATLYGLFVFKDRMWGFNANGLFYTDVAPIGGNPEQWAFATNTVPFVGPSGAATIKKVVPLSNKLLVFTTAGLWTLLVEGSPQSWILRILDSRSFSTTAQCAFESKGIVYYVNTSGVWATNGIYSTKLSGVIDDQFYLSKGWRLHSIVPYEDGMIVSIGKISVTGTALYYDAPNCRIFYSKLDPTAWTEWNIPSKATTPAAGVHRLCAIYSTSDKVPTFLNSDPTTYMLAQVSPSADGATTKGVMQLLIFDGGEDQYVNWSNVVQTQPVNIYLKTKSMDGGNQYNLKQNKRGLLEVFTSDAQHKFSTSWQIDATTSDGQAVRQTATISSTVGVGSNLIQIPAGFHYRRCGLILSCDLQTNTSQIKLKDMAIVQNTERSEFEKVR